MNYEAGYHSLSNYEENSKQKNTPNYINSVLVIEGYSKLDYYKNTDHRINNFIDHLILRSINLVNQRTHIPIIFETTDSLYFGKDYNDALSMEWRSISPINFSKPNLKDLLHCYSYISPNESMVKWTIMYYMPNTVRRMHKRSDKMKFKGKAAMRNYMEILLKEEKN